MLKYNEGRCRRDDHYSCTTCHHFERSGIWDVIVTWVFTILYGVILLTDCRQMNVSKAFMQLGFCICAHSHSEEEITTVLTQQVSLCLLDFFWVLKTSILKRCMLSVWLISTSRWHVFYVFLCLRACLLEKPDWKGYIYINKHEVLNEVQLDSCHSVCPCKLLVHNLLASWHKQCVWKYEWSSNPIE